MVCPTCGSTKLRKRSKQRNRYSCTVCGKWVTFKKEIALETKSDLTSWRQLTAIAKEHAKIREQNNPSYSSASVLIKKDKIVLLPIGDVHLGNDGTDYLFFEETIDLVKSKGLYVALIGDIIDMFYNTFKSAKAVFDQVLNLDEQHILFNSLLEEIDPYLIAATYGNHDNTRLENLLGIDLFGRMQSRLCPYFQGIGRLDLKVGNQEYRVVLTHAGKGKSKFNPNHGLYNLDREAVEGDLFIGGHYHNIAISSFEIRGRSVPALQIGTFKKSDPYSERYFRFDGYKRTLPAVFISGKDRKIILFEDVNDAIKFRDAC